MGKKGHAYLVTCRKVGTEERGCFSVPESVYTYVHQLEVHIKYPGKSRLLEAYPGLVPKNIEEESK